MALVHLEQTIRERYQRELADVDVSIGEKLAETRLNSPVCASVSLGWET